MRNNVPETLDPILVINAYTQGIFPMADPYGKIHWYAPDPRAILEHENLYVSRSLRATLHKQIYQVSIDTDFASVIQRCAEREETWINQSFIATYTQLHYAGLAHSVEAWKDEQLVGGLYGVSIGGAFMGESMFSHASDASKVCLVALVEHLKARGYVLHDVQFWTPHLASLGVTEIPRKHYERRLKAALRLECSWDG